MTLQLMNNGDVSSDLFLENMYIYIILYNIHTCMNMIVPHNTYTINQRALGIFSLGNQSRWGYISLVVPQVGTAKLVSSISVGFMVDISKVKPIKTNNPYSYLSICIYI